MRVRSAEGDDLEDWDDSDPDFDPDSDEDDDPTVPCPHCGRDIYDDSEWCPGCGRYLSREDAPGGGRPWWIVVGVVLCLMVVLGWVLR
ncbi:MAG: zinc ribbon domain-containing protein [Isosphaeraceae bacterium]